MERRSFLKGLFAAPIVAALPVSKAVVASSGTITGRWTSTVPAVQELTRSQVKALTFSRMYGANLDTVRRVVDVPRLQAMDLSRIEARVAANMQAGKDPYVLG